MQHRELINQGGFQMHRADQHSRSISWYCRILLTVLALACVILGVIGLVIPIIPGVVFLLIAVLLLSRISPRLKRWVRRKPEMNRIHSRFQAMGRLHWGERLRLSFWMAMNGVLQGAVFTGSIISRTAHFVRSRSSSRSTSQSV